MSNKHLKPIVKLLNGEFQSSSGLTPEFRSFSTKFKAAMGKTLLDAGAKLVKFNRGHFYNSGSYTFNGGIGFFSIPDVRGSFGKKDEIMFRVEMSPIRGSNSRANCWGCLSDEDIGEKMVKILT